jgi:predicted dehydrogenase
MGDVTHVTAKLGIVTGRYGEECDEYGEGMLLLANGAVGTLAAGWVDVADPVKVLISGTEGHVHVINDSVYFKSSHVPGADGEQPWTDLPAAWPHAFELFLDAVGGKAGVPLVSPQEAAVRSAVMEAMYRAHKQQAWVGVG